MFTFSLLLNYFKKINLSRNPKFNHTLNIYDLRANSYLEGLLVTTLTAVVPSPSLLRPLEHLGLHSGFAGPTADMWVHRFEPRFLMALDSGATVTSQYGHHVACHSTLLPPTHLPCSPGVTLEGRSWKETYSCCALSISLSCTVPPIGLGTMRHPYGVT